MIEIGSRARTQAPPPTVLFEALTQPDRPGAREWLLLADDEESPSVLEAVDPVLVVWSSLWLKRPDARIRFDIEPDGRSAGSTLRWTLSVEPPRPDDALVGHLRKRMNELVNRDLRYSFGQ